MKSKFTPGPWVIQYDHPDVRTLAAIRSPNMSPYLEIVNVFGCDGVNEETANAELIADSPYMIDLIYELYMEAGAQEEISGRLEQLLERAEALIEKHRGPA